MRKIFWSEWQESRHGHAFLQNSKKCFRTCISKRLNATWKFCRKRLSHSRPGHLTAASRSTRPSTTDKSSTRGTSAWLRPSGSRPEKASSLISRYFVSVLQYSIFVFLKNGPISVSFFVYFRHFLVTISIIQIEKTKMVHLGFELAAAGCRIRRNHGVSICLSSSFNFVHQYLA